MPLFREKAVLLGGAVLDGPVSGHFLAKNWPYFADLGANYGRCVFYHPTAHYWISFGHDGTDTSVQYSQDGRLWTTPSFSGLTGFTLSGAFACAANNLSTARLVLGGNPAGSSAAKLRTSTDGGITWSPVNAGGADSEQIITVAYSQATGFIAAGVPGAHTYQSASGTGTFTAGPSLSGNIQTMYAFPSLAFTLTDGATYYTSTNGTTWTARSWPASVFPQTLTYNSVWNQYYFAAGGDDGIWGSSTGTSGWTQLYNPGIHIRTITSFGSVLVAIKDDPGVTGVVTSVDGGVTWDTVASSSLTGIRQLLVATRQGAAGPHQLMWTSQSPLGQHYASLVG